MRCWYSVEYMHLEYKYRQYNLLLIILLYCIDVPVRYYYYRKGKPRYIGTTEAFQF